jgi:uncharacterized protein YggE
MHRTKHAITAAAVAALTALGAIAVGGGGSGLAGATTPTTDPTVTVTATGEEPTPTMNDRVISVVGTGRVSVTPDIAKVFMGFQTRAATTEEAMAALTEKSNALITTLTAVGIPAEDLQTSGLSLWQVYGNDGTSVTGYEASTNVTVTIRDIERVGEIVDAAQGFVGEGFTLGGISFESSDPEASMEEARVEAVENARVRAEQYAAAAGVEVGDVLRIVESGAVDVPMFRVAAADAEASGVAVEPGQQELTATVTVVFAMA